VGVGCVYTGATESLNRPVISEWTWNNLSDLRVRHNNALALTKARASALTNDCSVSSMRASAQHTGACVPSRISSNVLVQTSRISSNVLAHNFCEDFDHSAKPKLLYNVCKKSAAEFSEGGANKQFELQNDVLINLSRVVPSTLMASHAGSTNKAYSRIFNIWKAWSVDFPEVQALPADQYHVSLFLIDYAKKTQSAASVKLVLPALTWVHHMAGLTTTLNTQYLHNISLGLVRSLAKPRMPKEPVTLQNIIKLVETSDLKDLVDLRSICMIVLAFAAFLRFDELVKIRRSDLFFKNEFLEIIIRSSKTDQLRMGNSVLVGVTKNRTCPVALLKSYLLLAKIERDSNGFIFRNITNSKILRPSNLPMSYSRVRDLILQKFSSIGLNPKLFGLHSLRAGGATLAANSGIPDRLFKRHGRWRSENAKDAYIKDDIRSRLAVSMNLGL
jgi:integrase